MIATVEDALCLVMKIEERGGAFYRKAAEVTHDTLVVQLLLDLADQEAVHYGKFAEMRSGLPEEVLARGGIDGGGLDVDAMVEAGSLLAGRDPVSLLKGTESPEEILDLAIAFERDAVFLFLVFRSMLPGDAEKRHVDPIIVEEISHIRDLKSRKGRIAGGGE